VTVDADRLRSLAAEKFGWPRLHDEQVEAMLALMAGNDVLAVLPTGAGKSAIYQGPALLLGGPTVVVSPLLALQRYQIDSLDDRPLPDAVALNSRPGAGCLPVRGGRSPLRATPARPAPAPASRPATGSSA
jgi:ATP-dependent DNA helicase RecQ